MQTTLILTLLLALAPAARAEETNPLAKVLELIDELSAKTIAEGEAEAKAFKEYFEWCDDTAKNGAFAIKTATSESEKLTAKIGKLSSEIDSCITKIEELAASIATDSKELEEATAIRDKEAATFAASEKELMDAVDTLERAVSVISKEMAKSPASFAQVTTTNMQGLIQAVGAILDAASFYSQDQKKLVALVQARQTAASDAADADEELGAPAAAVYESKSGGIVDVLEDMKEKAEGQLSDLRKAETNGQHNYDMLKQSLEDSIKADTTDKDQEAETKAAAEEGKATATGELEATTKELAAAKEELAVAQSTCMQTASDHEASVRSRGEELAAIAKAKQILEETSGGAVGQSYSFLQMSSKTDLKRAEVITVVERLAKKHHSAALAQLASRINAVVRMGSASGANPFEKVKGLITDMISKLEKEAGDEETEKAYCDEEMSKTEEKKGELEADISKMTAKIDQAAATSAELKEQVAELESELAALAKEQEEMDKIRADQHAAYTTAKADLELGLSGVKKALTVLRDYYAAEEGAAMIQNNEASFGAFMQQPAMPESHSKSGGAGGSIIGILEVCESDFATTLAKEETQEADSADEYEKMTQENAVVKTAKDQDVKYKTQEAASLDKALAEVSGDRETSSTELAAVDEYYSKIKDRCIAKPETYEERKARREAEIAGLKEALSILEDETAFVQSRKRGNMRGNTLAVDA